MSRYSNEEIGARLKKARLQKKWSQRTLSLSVGIPQSHISKIENGAVDLQTSSLIQLARILDLELMLVPRQLVPSFQALMRERQKGASESIPMYRLEEEEDD